MTSKKPMVLGLTQFRASSDPSECWQTFEAQAEEAVSLGATIVSCQELFTSPYFCQGQEARHFDLAEPVPGPSTERLQKLAARLKAVVVGSFFERRAPGLYHNTAAVADADGTLLGIYRKLHIPQDPGFDEKYYFAPGDLGVKVFDTAVGRVAVEICWDQWYPESARLAALQGAELVLYPTAIAWDDLEDPSVRPLQYDAWQTMMRSHAIANGMYVGASNRVGREGRLTFWGGSFVADPEGRVLSQSSFSGDEVSVVELPREKIEETRRVWPFLRDRRIDAYQGLLHRYGHGA